MKKVWFLGVTASCILAACSSEDEQLSADELAEKDWDAIKESAEGAEIGMYMWGGDDSVNRYIDDIVVPHLDENYDVTLERYPMDAPDFLNRLMSEKEAGDQDGTADVLWINGENFRTAKQNDLLYGEFTHLLPNMEEYIGDEASFVHIDMGTEIEGYEAPWGNVQFAFQYDADRVDDPPSTMDELIEWSIDNPGEFTYPNVNDFTGNSFISHMLYSVADSPDELEEYDEEWLRANEEELWSKLNDFQDSLWREGQTYPDDLSQLDQMYADGEVSFTMGFNEHRAESMIEDDVFPESTETIFLEEPGSIGSTHYLSMPFNTTEPEAALIAINYMISAEAQIKKLDPSLWGEGHVLDSDLLSEEQQAEIEEHLGDDAVEADADIILPELDSRYHDWIIDRWEEEVVQ
ncbi:ABC transporter substrate-binding protein [Salisediminibacterium halotolerans]|uniref:Spermidine/putrescine transport system substrate-binding protein n=1 Tax=Salisediminibacterium halotolerans TaxID=517425 RepID=A0A1H9UEU3_9BACI|nr:MULTISPECIES: ABC transporter substrate-binding protein [Salisediminibacterium]RLJ69249.1 putative spermidine/putrescine transport system substrate-binding protein [Actinophytocola xinjiangensis]RPE87016.1 putative spermidine/putrescine transport system substrate-binding protein [Salisediminibacterium halotolerans]TWG32251.1 putative spermidine/putrescine transport system substrate-binding protein [Salisediminibacterium halotolerans]SES07869.1 putative spermidine/putrescine transport system 